MSRLTISRAVVRGDDPHHPPRFRGAQEAGFPVFDDRSRDDGRTRWLINGQAFKGLAAGLTLAELSALYFSRTLVASLAGTPFRDDVESAFNKPRRR